MNLIKKSKNITINLGLALLLLLLIPQVSSQVQDNDFDGIKDEFDRCPNTNPGVDLPIILRNPEFIGCSCQQIMEEIDNKYCKDIYCYPGRPLEIKERTTSLRSNPCPPSKCVGTTLYEYETDTIMCERGKEMPYECEEIVTENAERCIQNQNETLKNNTQTNEKDIYDTIITTYLEKSNFADLLQIKTKEELQKNDQELKKILNIERTEQISQRTINKQEISIQDIQITISPKKYYQLTDIIIIEKLTGNLSNKNIVIDQKKFYDEELQIIVWEINSLKEEKTLTYRITPTTKTTSEIIIQGKYKNLIFTKLIMPILILIIIITLFIYWIINAKEKSNVFKNQ